MEILHEDQPAATFETLPNLQTYSYCLDSGGIPTAACKADPRGSRVAYGKFQPEDAPKSLCSMHTTVQVCSESGKLARAHCPEESLTTVSRLNLYRYFAVPNVSVADEKYTVHFEGILSERILSYYYPATCSDGYALEGQCTIHVTAPQPTDPDVTDETGGTDSQPTEPPEPDIDTDG